ncbi:hypothetical protein, conserved [Babesia bigemina]|uniref:F-box domain-containing protein n=1 Tax=Babesia bigemina TaxID=5866 RepID=A0A061D7F4_BABBI|nr:hypothetical protein, conserved [Babesia bigemina]CDR96641.1 hypothetical protein, conserved [Babesia bigemina]|eukprot:XP_012768827.1 hypothetical protein, conserved [Babesia bigemina]
MGDTPLDAAATNLSQELKPVEIAACEADDTVVGEDEGYELEELKEVVQNILWDIVDTRRPLLRRLINAKTILEAPPPPPPKQGARKPKVPEVDGHALFEEVVKEILEIDEELGNLDREILDEQLFILCDNPPPVPPSEIQIILFRKNEQVTMFEHHEIMSRLFSFLDVQSLLEFSEASKLCREAVDTYARKAAYNLLLHRGSVCSNLSYWRQVIEFFFTEVVTLQPISRSNYQPIQAQLRMNKNVFPINTQSMKAHTHVSFDFIKPHYIVYCDHQRPMAHTCEASRALDCDRKAVTKVITANEFIVEYCKRLEVQDPDTPAWGVPASMVTPAYVALMLKVTLDTIAQCITKHSGLVEYRRTEYTANATHHITHRIWLQLSLKWDFRFGDDAQNSLYLNVFDHFRWDG